MIGLKCIWNSNFGYNSDCVIFYLFYKLLLLWLFFVYVGLWVIVEYLGDEIWKVEFCIMLLGIDSCMIEE